MTRVPLEVYMNVGIIGYQICIVIGGKKYEILSLEDRIDSGKPWMVAIDAIALEYLDNIIAREADSE
jgi:hypothetical protein